MILCEVALNPISPKSQIFFKHLLIIRLQTSIIAIPHKWLANKVTGQGTVFLSGQSDFSSFRQNHMSARFVKSPVTRYLQDSYVGLLSVWHPPCKMERQAATADKPGAHGIP